MRVSYSNSKLAKKINPESECLKYYGRDMAHAIHKRLAQLSASPTLDSARHFGRCHELKGDYEGCFAMDLVGPKRLIFKPDDETRSYLDEKTIIWSLVKSVEIVDIKDYH